MDRSECPHTLRNSPSGCAKHSERAREFSLGNRLCMQLVVQSPTNNLMCNVYPRPCHSMMLLIGHWSRGQAKVATSLMKADRRTKLSGAMLSTCSRVT